jgi:ribosomal-protein-alanine N-acetyltransferase
VTESGPVGAAGPELRTARLLLRRWRASDLDPFAAINADPAVMEYFAATLSREESAELIARIERGFDEHGYGLWAAEAPGETELIGFVGMEDVKPELPCAPAVEVGWRLDRRFWRRGLASEAAAGVVAFAFGRLGFDSLVATTSRPNERSRAVMERLGMSYDPAEDFIHPALPSDHPLAPHVLYRLDRTAWEGGRAVTDGEGGGSRSA